jgi:hypothetical protein
MENAGGVANAGTSASLGDGQRGRNDELVGYRVSAS